MKLVRIFGADNSADGIWSIRMDGKLNNEFDHFLETVQEPGWLIDFFGRNQADLHSGFFGNISTENAIDITILEVDLFEDVLYDYFDQGLKGTGINLQHLFRPLNNLEGVISIHQKSKARIGKGWVRIYAIRLSENCYVITGGAIKLSANMDREHLEHELKKLDRTKYFLKENGIIFPEDLNNFLYG